MRWAFRRKSAGGADASLIRQRRAGLTADVINTSGPDSKAGLLASVMQGSTDTTCYILAVYFGAVGVKKYRYALTVGLAADLVSFLAAVVFSGIFLGT